MFDTHCHLNDPKFEGDLSQVMERCKSAGIRGVLVAGYDTASSIRAGEIAREYTAAWCAAGLHPHDARTSLEDSGWLDRIRELNSENPKTVALGEIGLDFHYNFSGEDVQVDVFRQQIQLAHELSLPVTVHSRAAEDRVMDVLEDVGIPPAGAVLHSFNGTAQQAARAVEMGLYVGITGMITFKKSEGLREALRGVPLEKILLETDCPYLAPHPHRGKRNDPSYLPLIAEAAADFYGVELETIQAQAKANTLKVFQRMA